MDLPQDLPPRWEKKALIVVGVIFVGLVIYSFNPFVGTPTNNTTVEQQPSEPTVVPFPQTPKANSTTNNSSTNSSFKISSDNAKNIASQANPGYTAGNPMQGSIVVNGTTYLVWIVSLSQQNAVSKTIYIDGNTGVIVMSV